MRTGSDHAARTCNIRGNSLPMTRLIIADDSPEARFALRSMLKGSTAIDVIAEAATGHDALRLCRELKPDLLVVDMHLTDMDGLAVVKALRQELPALHVIILTMDGSPAPRSRALELGVDGYVLKGGPRRELLAAVHKSVSR